MGSNLTKRNPEKITVDELDTPFKITDVQETLDFDENTIIFHEDGSTVHVIVDSAVDIKIDTAVDVKVDTAADAKVDSTVDVKVDSDVDKKVDSIVDSAADVKIVLTNPQGNEVSITESYNKESATLNTNELTDGKRNIKFPSVQNEASGSVFQQSERKDREGIIFLQRTYLPKQPDDKFFDLKNNLDSDYFYKMDTFPRGILTIINVKDFMESSGMQKYPRSGTDADAESLCNLFLEMGFIVDRFDNPTSADVVRILKNAANQNYSKLSCCVVAVLTHGNEGIIYCTDTCLKIRDITKLFRTINLAGKPKLFFIQACQGSEYMSSLDQVDGPGSLPQKSKKEKVLNLPSESDFLYAYSTVPGYFAWRNARNGSWFIQAVVSVFRENAHKMDVLRLLTRVNEKISQNKSVTCDANTDNKRQIASAVSQLRKDLFLMPIYGPLKSLSKNEQH
ncbi:caspase-3 [Hydra vulgaris]|uniref:Caspase-3 n=1 Tax=Hydra vulgaris TaxID=6087 RepID=A0ABM4DJW1_HYDVU